MFDEYVIFEDFRDGKTAREMQKERETVSDNDRAENVLLLIVDLTILFSTISPNENRISMTTNKALMHK